MNIIKQAGNNKERQDTYRYQLGRYQRAIRNEFYFEALIIVYALLEDRFKSFLYYCGFFANRNSLKLYGRIKSYIIEICYGENAPDRLSPITHISTKADYITAILNWTTNVRAEDIEDNIYYYSLKHQIEGLDIGGLIDALDELTQKDMGWFSYRNEIIHASMNKNVEALYEDLAVKVERGMELARFIDSQVRILRKKGTVRKALKMQNN